MVANDQFFETVKNYFRGDIDRTWTWFKSPHSSLGMVTPLEAMRTGRVNKVAKLIDDALLGKSLL